MKDTLRIFCGLQSRYVQVMYNEGVGKHAILLTEKKHGRGPFEKGGETRALRSMEPAKVSKLRGRNIT